MTTTTETNSAEATKEVVGDTTEKKESVGSPKKEVAPPKPSVHKQDFEKDVVYLYQFPRTPTIASVSAFCLKVETYLRVAGIKYENVDNKVRHKSKKGQLPFIELNGEEIADSDIILKELSSKFGKNLDDGLTQEQKVQSHAFESMLNNHTSWVVRYWRYNHPDQFLAASQIDIKRTFNSKLPAGVLNFIFKWGFKRNVVSAVSHGIGHHSDTEAIDFGKSDLQSLSQFLGKKDYFFGKTPHQLDVVAFAHVSQFVFVPFEGMKEWMETETPNLVSFVNRMKDKYWPDWDEMCKSLEINTHLPKKELSPEELEEQKKAEEKKAEEQRKKEEKKKEKVSKKKAKSKTCPSPDPASKDPGNEAVAESSAEGTEASSSARPTRSSQSFRLPSLVSISRTLSNVTRKTGTYRFSSQSLTPEQQEERKKAKEEEKKKAKEEKERKKKEAEEAKAKAAQEKKEKEEQEKKEKEEKERLEKEKKEAEAKAEAEKKEEPKEEAKEEKKE